MAERIDIAVAVRGAQKAAAEIQTVAGATAAVGPAAQRSSVQAAKANRNLSKSFATTGRSLTKYLTGPILAMGAVALKGSVEVGRGQRAIIKGTGAQGKALDSLMGSLRRVDTSTAGLGFTTEQVAQGIADINTRTGLTGRPLEELTGRMLKLAKVTGMEVPSATRLATRAFGDWGVAAKDQNAFLDKVLATSQATGIGADELMGTVVQYGAPLRQLGFNVNESMAMLGKWEREGVNVQTMLSGLRFGLGGFAKAGKDPKKALRDVMKAIEGAGSAAEANDLAVRTFGRRAGADMAAGLREGRFAYDDLVKMIEGSGGTLDKTHENTITSVERMKGAFKELYWALAPLGTVLFLQLANAARILGTVFSGIGKAVDKIPGPAQKMLLAFAGVLAVVGPSLAVTGKLMAWWKKGSLGVIALQKALGLLKIAMTFIAAHPLILVLAGVAIILYLLWTRSEKFRNAVKAMGAAAIAAFEWIKGAAQATWNWIRSNWKLLITIIAGPIGAAVALVATYWDEITAGAAAIWHWFQDVWGLLGDVISAPFEWAWDKIRPIYDKIKEVVGLVQSLLPGGSNAPTSANITGQQNTAGGTVGGATNATGTSFWRGGMSLVGERGPEVVNLPRGSRVYPARYSNEVAGRDVVIHVHTHLDGREVAINTVRHQMAAGARA